VRRTIPHVRGDEEAEGPQWRFDITTRTVGLGCGISCTTKVLRSPTRSAACLSHGQPAVLIRNRTGLEAHRVATCPVHGRQRRPQASSDYKLGLSQSSHALEFHRHSISPGTVARCMTKRTLPRPASSERGPCWDHLGNVVWNAVWGIARRQSRSHKQTKSNASRGRELGSCSYARFHCFRNPILKVYLYSRKPR
jgi:hypothetical protein